MWVKAWSFRFFPYISYSSILLNSLFIFTILRGNSQNGHPPITGQELPSSNAGNLTVDVIGIGIRSGANVRLEVSVFIFPLAHSWILVDSFLIFNILLGKLQNSHPQITGQKVPSANDVNHTEDLMQNHDVLLSTLRSRLTKLQVSSAAPNWHGYGDYCL